MLDHPSNRIDDVRLQTFNVAYDLPFVFTRDAFTPGNRALIDVMTRREPNKRHRFAVLVDESVLAAIPVLPRRIEDYAALYPNSVEMVAPVIPVKGGEVCKNDPDIVSWLLS